MPRSGKTGISSRSSLRPTIPPQADEFPCNKAWIMTACSVPGIGHKGPLRCLAVAGPGLPGVSLRRYSPVMALHRDLPGNDVTGVTHRYVETRGLRMHIAEAGEGPLVVLLHGFPECWYSWRHQLTALAGAGYHAVAPDQRGYCRTGGPQAADQYTILHLTGDVIALLDALGEARAVVAGHDWGAPVAWHAALLRPDRVRGVIGLSVPYRPRGSSPPIAALRSSVGDGFYMIYFQQSGVADAELARDLRQTFTRVLYGASGGAPAVVPIVPPGAGFLDICAEPPASGLPAWLTSAD